MPDPKFHLAIPVNNLEQTRKFYTEIIGASEGRSDTSWVDFNFFGHQLVAHLDRTNDQNSKTLSNHVDGDLVPIPHFGAILDHDEWESLINRLIQSEWPFELEPHVRFQGLPGEQWTMFVHDPSGNALEFKYFENPGQLFATE